VPTRTGIFRPLRSSLPLRSSAGAQAMGRWRVPDLARLERPRWHLANISEQRVLKAGLIQLQQELAKNAEPAALLELPRRRDGSPLIMQASFLRRLLSAELDLKVCMECDVSGAQLDLRHLAMEQLLAIRVRTLDFSTDSESHSAHKNFLLTVDLHLFEKLARHCLQGASAGVIPRRSQTLHALGVHVVLTLGAIEVLSSGWDSRATSSNSGTPIPPCWAVKLDERNWPGCSIALLHAGPLRLEVLPQECADVSKSAGGGHVAVVWDHSSGTGANRRLDWEVFALDPQSDDVLAAVAQQDDTAAEALASELSAAIKRRSITRLAALGLPPEPPAGQVEATSPQRPAASAPEVRTPVAGRVAAAVQRIDSVSTPPPPIASVKPASVEQRKRPEAEGPFGHTPPRRTSASAAAVPELPGSGQREQQPPAAQERPPPSASQEPSAAPEQPPPGAPAEPVRVSVPPEYDAADCAILPCICSRSSSKPQALCVPECFKGIFG